MSGVDVDRDPLAARFSTGSRLLRGAPHGYGVAEVSVLTGRVRLLRLPELRFLHYLRGYFEGIEASDVSEGEAVRGAAGKAGVTEEWAGRYLKSKRYKAWVADRLAEVAIREGVTVEYLMKKHKANVEGAGPRLTMSQQKSLEELGERIWPKTSRVEHQVEAKDSRGMEEIAKVREEVDALETKLKEAVEQSKAGA